MDDREWTTRTPEPGARLSCEGLAIGCAHEGGAALISGDLAAAMDALAPGAPILGLLEDLPPGPHALRIARDRALLCTDAPLHRNGWQDGFAVSAADDLFVRIDITGDRADEIRSSCMSTGRGSPSASTFFAGFVALIGTIPDGFRVRVSAPEAAALWAHLERLVRTL